MENKKKIATRESYGSLRKGGTGLQDLTIKTGGI